MIISTMRRAGTALALTLAVAGCDGGNLFTEQPVTAAGTVADGQVTGRVLEAGGGVGGVEVILVDYASTSTDGAGTYRFREVPAGVYSMQIRLPPNYTLADGEDFVRTVTVGADRATVVNWRLNRDVGVVP